MPDFNTLVGWATIIIVPLTIVAIVVTVWGIRRGRRKRALACGLQLVEFPLDVKNSEEVGGDIEIRYDGKLIDNLYIVRARLKHTGINDAIRKSDIVEPITFDFGPDAKILREPKIIAQTPNNLKIDVQFVSYQEQVSFAIGPVAADFQVVTYYESPSIYIDLLNDGEEFTVEFVCTSDSEVVKPIVSARIEGVKEIEVLKEVENVPKTPLDIISSAWTSVVIFTIFLLIVLQIIDSIFGL